MNEKDLLEKVKKIPLEHPVRRPVAEFWSTLTLKHAAWPSLVYFATQIRLIQEDMPSGSRLRLVDTASQTIQSLLKCLFPEEEFKQRLKELIADTEKLTELGFDAVTQLEAEGEAKH